MMYQLETLAWPYDTYLELLEDVHIEVFEGLPQPAPPNHCVSHQYVLSEVHYQLRKFLEERNSDGLLLLGSVSVVFDETSIVQPDMFYLAKDGNKHISEVSVDCVPDIIFEVVSTGSHHRDNHDKYLLYEKYRVPEFWLIYPHHQTISIFGIDENDTFQSLSQGYLGSSNQHTHVESRVLRGFRLDLRTVFSRLPLKKKPQKN